MFLLCSHSEFVDVYMPEQFCLPGLAPGKERDALFFAVLPDLERTLLITQLREQLCRDHGLEIRQLIAPECFHLSLHAIGEYDGVPNDVVRRAEDAAALVSMPPFSIALDRAMSFLGKPDKRPFVLRAARQSPELVALYGVLGDAMKRVGFRHVRLSGFTPHLTLLYQDRLVTEREIEAVRVDVRGFVLVHSLRGRGPNKHIPLAHWQLSQSLQFGLEEAASPVYAKPRSAVHQGVAVPQGVLNLPF